jgi:hypothetical protein
MMDAEGGGHAGRRDKFVFSRPDFEKVLEIERQSSQCGG